MDEEKEIARLAFVFVFSCVVGIAVGVSRGIVQEKIGDWRIMVRSVTASILVAVFVGFALADTNFSLTMKSAITGVSALIADDVLLGLMALGKILGRDPFGFLSRVMAAYRGQIKNEIEKEKT
jgi:predicted permease